jgi:hypothetical protein
MASENRSDQNEEEPKLIIDEDWKTQVQREKEALKQKKQSASESLAAGQSVPEAGQSEPAAGQSEPAAGQSVAEAGEATAGRAESSGSQASRVSDADQSTLKDEEAPPATFEYLVSGMATQALAAMGQIPDEEGKPFPANMGYARHYIDLLGVLETKTKGNLTDQEQRFLMDALHQLRILFVTVKKG